MNTILFSPQVDCIWLRVKRMEWILHKTPSVGKDADRIKSAMEGVSGSA